MDIIQGDSGRGLRLHGRLVESAGFVLVGVLAGVAAKLADESGIGWLGDLGTYPALWVLALALIARVSPRAGAAAVRAGGVFAAMVGGYYAWAVLALGFPKGPELRLAFHPSPQSRVGAIPHGPTAHRGG